MKLPFLPRNLSSLSTALWLSGLSILGTLDAGADGPKSYDIDFVVRCFGSTKVTVKGVDYTGEQEGKTTIEEGQQVTVVVHYEEEIRLVCPNEGLLSGGSCVLFAPYDAWLPREEVSFNGTEWVMLNGCMGGSVKLNGPGPYSGEESELTKDSEGQVLIECFQDYSFPPQQGCGSNASTWTFTGCDCLLLEFRGPNSDWADLTTSTGMFSPEMGQSSENCSGQGSTTYTIRIKPPEESDDAPGPGNCPSCGSTAGGGGGGVSVVPGSGPQFNHPAIKDAMGTGTDAANLTLQAGPLTFQNVLGSSIERSDFTFEPYANVTSDVVMEGGALRQIRTPTTLVDLVDINDGVEVRIYRENLPATPVNGLYTPPAGAPAVKRSYVKAEDSEFGDGFIYTQVNSSGTKTYEHYATTTPTGQIWKLVRNGLQVEEGMETLVAHSESTWTRTMQVTRKSVQGGGSPMTTEVETSKYQVKSWGKEALTQRILVKGGVTVTTNYTFHETLGNPGYGRVHYWAASDGTWERTIYDEEGGVSKIVRPWLLFTVNPATAEHDDEKTKATVYLKRNIGVKKENVVQEWLDGKLMSETVSFESKDPNTENILRTTQTALKISAGDSDPKTEEISAYEAVDTPGGGKRAGKLLWIQSSDGRLTSYSSEEGQWNGTTFTAGSGPATRRYVTQGTEASPAGVANRTTRTMTISVVEVGTVYEETQVYTGSGYEKVQERTYEYEATGERRLLKTYQDEVLVSETVYGAPGTVTQIDKTGRETTTVSDPGTGELISQTQEGRGGRADTVTTASMTLVAAGEQVATTVTSAGLSQSSVSVTSPSGELLSSTDGMGRVTTYSRGVSGGLRTETATGPGGVTRTAAYHPDGSIHSVTGTGTLPEYYAYETATENGISVLKTTIRQGASDSPRFETTLTNGFGQVVKTIRPGPPGSGETTVSSVLVHTPGGHQLSQTRPGLGTLLSPLPTGPYGARQQAVDRNNNGQVDQAGTDQIVETDTEYEKISGVWWRVATQKSWLTDNNGTATEMVRQRTRLGLGPNAETQTSYANGRTETVLNTVNRTTGEVTVTKTGNSFAGSEVSVHRDGLLLSHQRPEHSAAAVYTYDALGRLTGVTDPRTELATTKTYNAAGLLTAETLPGGITTTYAYYPAGHANAGQLFWKKNGLGEWVAYAYNARGQVTHQWGSGDYPLRYEYDSWGDLVTLHTYRADPVEFRGANPPTVPGLPGAFGNTPSSLTTWVRHAATGLVTQKLDAASQGATYTYNLAGLVSSRTWARDNGAFVTTYGYDSLGSLVGTDYNDTTPDVAMTYRRDGQVKTLADAAGVHTFSYTAAGAPVGESVSGGAQDGYVLSYPNDGLGRRSGLTATLGAATLNAVDYGYDNRSRLETVAFDEAFHDGVSVTTSYVGNSDLPHQIVTRNGNNDVVLTGMRTYDAIGRVDTQYSSPEGIVVKHDYTYDAAHRRTAVLREDGSTWHYGYNTRGEVIGADRTLPNAEKLQGWSRSYQYDAIGNRITSSEGGEPGAGGALTTSYTANSLNQYEAIASPTQTAVIGQADSDAAVKVNGQPTSRQAGGYYHALLGANNANGPAWVPVSVTATKTGIGVAAADVTTTQAGHVFVPPALLEPAYDPDGNLTSDAEWIYQWDGENRLIAQETGIAAKAGGVPRMRIEHGYDGKSRRIAKRVYTRATDGDPWALQSDDRFFYDDYWNTTAWVDGATGQIKQAYLWAHDLSGDFRGAGGVGGLLAAVDNTEQEPRSWAYAYDGNGNAVALINLATTLVAGFGEYDPFGHAISTVGVFNEANRRGFSTKHVDESGLLYYGRRFYMSNMGRWASRDAIGEQGGINIFTMCKNRATTLIDPIGNDVLVLDNEGSGSQPTVLAGGLDSRPSLIRFIEGDYKDKKSINIDIYSKFQNAHARSDITSRIKSAASSMSYDKIFALIVGHGSVPGQVPISSGGRDYHYGVDAVKNHTILLDEEANTAELQSEVSLLNVDKIIVDIYSCYWTREYPIKKRGLPYGIFPNLPGSSLDLDTSVPYFRTCARGGEATAWRSLIRHQINAALATPGVKNPCNVAIYIFGGKESP